MLPKREPNIAEYAVKPPYFEEISARAIGTSSFILFGDRGAGKSATRLTVFREIWSRKAAGDRVPLPVSLIDFSGVVKGKKVANLDEAALISEVAFLTVEQILTWLSSLSDDDRQLYTEALTKEEINLVSSMLQEFYFSRPEMKRNLSIREAMTLMNQAWTARSKLWLERKWDNIAGLVGGIAQGFAQRYAGSGAKIAPAVSEILTDGTEDPNPYSARVVLAKLAQLAQVFDFSGVAILIDKVDETEATTNSAEATTTIILSHIQLLEVAGFAWLFFLWSQVKSFLEGGKFKVRLDKIGLASVTWDDVFFTEMLNRRLLFFSKGEVNFSRLCDPDINSNEILAELIKISMRSPRELIRLMDIIIREHDVVHSSKPDIVLLNRASFDIGMDKYVKDVINAVYGERLLGQIYRLNSIVLTNKDVQLTFKVNAQSARTRIQSWEDAGIVKKTGTRAAEGNLGGAPANEYSVVDARVARLIERQLVAYDALDAPVESGEAGDDDT